MFLDDGFRFAGLFLRCKRLMVVMTETNCFSLFTAKIMGFNHNYLIKPNNARSSFCVLTTDCLKPFHSIRWYVTTSCSTYLTKILSEKLSLT